MDASTPSKHGGRREGAGRKPSGRVWRHIGLTEPAWRELERRGGWKWLEALLAPQK